MNEKRHIRQIALPQVGIVGQEKLKRARVLVVGAGGLGNAVLPYLASSGIGTIGILDGDKIDLTNLHRQVLFSELELGKSKAIVASQKLSIQFPEIAITPYDSFLTGENALDLFLNYDLVIDATDSIDARYLINDACIVTKKPFVHASIYRFQFQVAIFNAKGSGTYRCLYPNAPSSSQSCEEAGVMPSTVAMAGLYQANEVFKYILQVGDLQTNSILLVDTLSNNHNHFSFKNRNQEHINPSFFERTYKSILQISINDVDKNGFFLDVRNEEELPILELENSRQIPISLLQKGMELIPKNQPVYLFCQSGIRSRKAYWILKESGWANLHCLAENAPEISEIQHRILR